MALLPNTRLGPYEILSALGAGGMGEVYKARDTRLDRTVAIKVLPAAWTADPERRLRFEREAKAISSLSHPNICALYDIGQQDDADYLVMEHLEGETLAGRLSKGPLPGDQLLRYAAEIAGGLDQAHRHGVVHRDLKPANIMLTKSGAKLLDFGLAKMREKSEVPAATALATRTQALTTEGTLVGTFQYMAPEQLEGKEADARSDIFAFGAVLYEMATGRKAFDGKSQASVIASILAAEPPPVSALSPAAPAAIDHLVRTCLAKDPDERVQSMHDVLLELKWAAGSGVLSSSAQLPAVPRRATRERMTWTAATAVLLLGVVSLAVMLFRKKPPEAPAVRFSVYPPDKTAFASWVGSGPVLVSPDGQRLAFVGSGANGYELWVRPLDSLAPQLLPGTKGAVYPFWSPDSRYLAFFAEGKLKKVAVSGGPPQTLCDAVDGRGGAWASGNGDGVIIFAPGAQSAIYRISAGGGEPVAVTTRDTAHTEASHRFPEFLPDGRHFLFVATREDLEHTAIFVGDLDSPAGSKSVRLMENSSRVSYEPPGYLLFVRENTLLAQPFDAGRIALTGEPAALADHVSGGGIRNTANFSVSATGVLAWRGETGEEQRHVYWVDRQGKQLPGLDLRGPYLIPRLSPDEKRAALASALTASVNIWLLDISRNAASKFTFATGLQTTPVWSPDGSKIVFSSAVHANNDLYWKDANGLGSEDLVLENRNTKWPTDWSRDGRFVVYEEIDPQTKNDLWLLPLFGDRKPVVFLKTPYAERGAMFSPDGRWIAYVSDESGRREVYVRPFAWGANATEGAKWQISTSGGDMPAWRRDGKELFYRAADQHLMAVPILPGASFQAGTPLPLFELPGPADYPFLNYSVGGGGQRFLITAPLGDARPPVNVCLNWLAVLKRQ